MLVELSLGGVLVPSLLLYALASVVLFVIVDHVGSALGVYRLFWHPALVRVALWTCLFSGLVAVARNWTMP
jgi:hypothetical protein